MKILITTHGDMCKGIVNSYEMLAGKNTHFEVLELQPDDTGQFKKEVNEFIDKEKEDLLILCGLKGGSPYNECFEAYLKHSDRIRLVSGLNLSMLLETGMALTAETPSLDKIAEIAVKAGKEGVYLATDSSQNDNEIEF